MKETGENVDDCVDFFNMIKMGNPNDFVKDCSDIESLFNYTTTY